MDIKLYRSLFVATLVVVSTLFNSSLRGEETPLSVKERWSGAVELYSQGSYSESLEQFLSLESEGFSSWQLYYNIANCHFKLRGWGSSILYYERALKLNPSSEDIVENLKFVEQFRVDKIEVIPQFILATWLKEFNYKLNSNSWGWLSLLALSITLALLLNYRYGKNRTRRKTALILALFSLLMTLLFSLFSYTQKSAQLAEDEAIVMSALSTVRNSPNSSGNTLFILHEGSKVQLIEQLGEWYRVKLSDGRQGWLRSEEIEII